MSSPKLNQLVREAHEQNNYDSLISLIPYAKLLGIECLRLGDDMVFRLPASQDNIGNPTLPALHGGVTAAFLEVAAIIELAWSTLWEGMEQGQIDPSEIGTSPLHLPKTIDFTVDYLRAGLPRDAYARARVNRSGRRYASVHVEAWQDNRSRLFAQGTGHFLMPPGPDEPAE